MREQIVKKNKAKQGDIQEAISAIIWVRTNLEQSVVSAGCSGKTQRRGIQD